MSSDFCTDPLQLASLAVALVSRVWFYFSVNHGREWLKDEQTTVSDHVVLDC